jgi:hypothetical protein
MVIISCYSIRRLDGNQCSIDPCLRVCMPMLLRQEDRPATTGRSRSDAKDESPEAGQTYVGASSMGRPLRFNPLCMK